MDVAERHSPTTSVHTALEDDEDATENIFGAANESQLSLASQPSAVSTGKKRGRKSNWQPIEIVIALFCRVFAQTEHGSRSKDASRYLSAKTQYGLVARALQAFLNAPGSPWYAWPEDVDIELTIRERTQGQSDITGELLYRKGNDLKSYLRQYTAKFATVYAAANDGKYIPPSGYNDGTAAWVAAEKTVEANYSAQSRTSTNDAHGGYETKVSVALFEAAALSFRLLCPQSPFNVEHCNELKSYIAAAWNLDPSRRLDQHGEPTEKDMKKAAKQAQKAAMHSTYMAQTELTENLNSQLAKVTGVLETIMEQRAVRAASHTLSRDSDGDLNDEIERRVRARLSEHEDEMERRIETRLLERLATVQNTALETIDTERIDFLTPAPTVTAPGEAATVAMDEHIPTEPARVQSPPVEAVQPSRASKRRNAGVKPNKWNE